MKTSISFEEFVSKKHERPSEICCKCGRHKEIYTHLNGEKGKPLCNACNMQMRRESPGAIQVKLLKLCATAIGSVESMLGMPVEEKQKKSLQDMQGELKLMVRAWLGDPQADENAEDATEAVQVAKSPTSPVSDEFSKARKSAVSKESDKLFETRKNAPSARRSRKALVAAKVEQRNVAKAKGDDPKAKTKREQVKPEESSEEITETTPHGYYSRLNRKPKNATQEAQPWEIFMNVNGAKPKFCCRESGKPDAEAQMWKLDHIAEEEQQNTATTTTNNEAAREAAAV